ncbi:ABC transporter substrate-binding protein [Brevibacillus sp. MS2.2]|uniref:ABC transporter substrate-binding protein n=1 Tax=Brevibacillus sp. MS2.2 TaxID=2738981 RepID=UPI00156B4F73|nr:ABC transporter substrate-binding protein [Brevibacillus sp. MS2.2]NRR19692.1 ABC transporter substrate-binding protein [Brevibacillus sp. MS2.2]
MLTNQTVKAVLAVIFVFSLFLTACGGANTETPAPATASASKLADKSTEAPAENKMRRIETPKGTIQIPDKPQRIVTDYYAGELIAVGGNVVGAETEAFKSPFTVEQLKNAQDVGSPRINVEKTLELAPDLIVVMYDDNYEALSKIAPTVYLPFGTATNIYDTVKLFGEVVGDKEKADRFIADFDKKAAEGREKLKGIVDENATVGLYELTNKGDLWIFGDNAGRGGQTVYNALKLKMPHADKSKEQTVQLSMETLPEYAADYMFVTFYNPDKNSEALKTLQASAVWNATSAAKNNQIFYNDYDTFYRYDPIAITAQINMIVDMLIKRHEENKSKK